MSIASALVLTLALAADGDAVLLEFTAEWCGPCRVMEPTMGRLVAAGYPVRKIDVDRDKATASRFRVSGVPCFVMLAGGQEVDRVTGAVSYDRLIQMYEQARVRAPHRAAPPAPEFSPRGDVVRAQSPDGVVPTSGHFGSSAASPAVASPARPAATAFPQTSPPRTVQTPSSSGVDPAAVRAAFQATVRLRVEDPQGHGCGTGTIIDVHGGEALVATCGHLFRESAGKGEIQVDLFATNPPRTVPGHLISYDLERDIALVSITPGQPISPARVASSGQGLGRGVAVFSIGCDKGQPPSVRESHVTSIDKYLGPPNIEVAGQPIEGRSGGGLFSGDGRLIGICNAADPADNEGIYAGLPTIHWELDRIGQRRVYEAAAQPQLAQANPAAATMPQAFASAGVPPSMPDRLVVPAIASQVQHDDLVPVGPVADSFDVDSLGPDTEVICIIRSRRDPRGDQRLLVLDNPSADLLARLRQASQPGAAAASIARQPAAPHRRSAEPVIRAQSADR